MIFVSIIIGEWVLLIISLYCHSDNVELIPK